MQLNPYAYSYKPIPNTPYNILEGKIKLIEDPLDPGNYPLFANCTLKEPLPNIDGYVNSFNTTTNNWEYIENHIGEQGFLDNKLYIICEYGPYPSGFSDTLSLNEQYVLREVEVKSIIKTILNRTDYFILDDYPLDHASKEKIIEFRRTVRELDNLQDYPFIDKPIPIPEWPLKHKKCPYLDILPIIK